MSIRAEKGVNDLLTLYPDLASEWHAILNEGLLPCDVTPGSNKKVYWKCPKCSYVWQAQICNRAKLKRGCPCCANKVVVKGVNDLATTNPEIAKEWYQPLNGDTTPYDVTHGCGKKYNWLCPRGHIYSATVLHRTSGAGTKCPVCNSGRHTSFAEQALLFYVKYLFPSAINGYKDIFEKGMELDIYIPDEKLGIEYDGVYWHHKKAVAVEREKRKYEICKQYGIKLLRIREKSNIENENPAADECIFLKDDGTDERELKNAIEAAIQWLMYNSCFNTGESKNVIPKIDIGKDRYEILSYLQGPIKNSVQEVAPELVKEWDYKKNGELKPDMIAAGSSQPINWICSTCGYSWEAKVYHRVKNHTGCPKCAGFVFEKGVNDLETKCPELLVDWDYKGNSSKGIIPDEIIYNSGQRVKWICHKCGYKWSIPLNSRSVRGTGCIKCGYGEGKTTKHKQILAKQGAITDPLLLKEWDYEKNTQIGIFPENLTPGSTESVYWICSKCGYQWKAPVARRKNGAGCRKCADKANPDLKRKRLIQKGHVLDNPLLLKEWDYQKNVKKPSDYTYGSKEIVYWKCSKCGFSWAAAIGPRNKGVGCPACAGNVVILGKNDLATIKPILAREWDYNKNGNVLPEQVTYSSGKKYWWICPKGHDSYSATPSHRVNGTGCPLCGKQMISEKARRPVDQLSVDGKLLRTFNSAKEAAEELKIHRSAISNAIRRGTTSGGYKWRHSDNRK